MTKKEAIKVFGTPKKLAKYLGISQTAVYLWPDSAIPKRREYEIREYIKSRKDELPDKTAA